MSTYEDDYKKQLELERTRHNRRIAIARQVASILGDDWQYTPFLSKDQSEYPYIKRADGMLLHFGQAAYNKQDRLAISLDLNPYAEIGTRLYDYKPYDVKVIPSITVDAARDAAVIAKDITRRLLPEASRVYLATLQRYNESQDYKARQKSTLHKMLDIRPGVFRVYMSGRDDDSRFYASDNHLSIEGEAYPDSVSLRLSNVPLDVAEKILSMIVSQ